MLEATHEPLNCPACDRLLLYDGKPCNCGSGYYRDVARDEDGNVATAFTQVPLGSVKIEFLNKRQEPYTQGEIVSVCSFRISGCGINPLAVRSVRFPVLDYSRADVALLLVEQYVYVASNVNEGGA
jgi:hypothetical protein